jgi:hypothetical protein
LVRIVHWRRCVRVDRGHGWFVPCEMTLGPSRLDWNSRIGTTASADFWRAPIGLLRRPRLSGKPYSRVRFQISPDKGRDLSPPKCHIYLHSVFQSGFALSRTLTWSYRPDVISVRHLAGLGDRTDGAVGCRESSGLPLHGLLPRRSCPHLVLISYELSIWYDDSLIEMTGTKHRGLAPHKITPMLGVHARRVLECLLGNGPSTPRTG